MSYYLLYLCGEFLLPSLERIISLVYSIGVLHIRYIDNQTIPIYIIVLFLETILHLLLLINRRGSYCIYMPST